MRGRAVSRRYRNRRIGEFLKELDLTEGRATGIPKILRAMRLNGSPTPKFEVDVDRTSFLIRLPVHPRAKPIVAEQFAGEVTTEVTTEVGRLLPLCTAAKSRQQLQAELGLRNEAHFHKAYMQPALLAGMLEKTVPDKPNSRLQKYRLTRKGADWLAARRNPENPV